MSSAFEEALLEDGYDPSEVEREVAAGSMEEAAREGARRLGEKLAAGPGPGEAAAALRELGRRGRRLNGQLSPRLRSAPAPQLRHQVPNRRVELKVVELLAKLRGAETPAQVEACERMAALLVLALNEVFWELHEAEAGARVEERLSRGLTERR